MTKTYSQLRAKIIEKVPSILDLEFGCEVEVKMFDDPYYKNGNYKAILLYSGDNNTIFRISMVKKPNKKMSPSIYLSGKKQTKILGRKIRLDDCTELFSLAGEKTYLTLNWKHGYLKDQDEELIQWMLNNI